MNDRTIIVLGLIILLTTPLWIGFIEGFFAAVDLGGRLDEFGDKMNLTGKRLGWWVAGKKVDSEGKDIDA